ncbi:hypothetical protein ACM55G_06940 [Flavobacterium sp. LB3P122]|uniref:hypothetical protein n=1 Tax=Flavobacterium algoriphilum TaxID=3398738 RepID=UPI003A8C2A19
MKNKDAVSSIRKEIIKSSSLAFETILKLPELKRYYLGLKYVTTSNNAICKAISIPIEAGTRYKADLENNYYLVASSDKFQCDYTGEYVQFLSTNPAEFERLKKSDINQLNLFDDGN